MWWKIYFWVYSVMTVSGLLIMFPTIPSWNFATWEGVIENILLVLGLYVYVFKKDMLSRDVWKYVFIAILIFWIAGLIYYQTKFPPLNFLESNFKFSLGEIIFSIIISMPALVAIYRLGFSAQKKKK